MTKAEKTKKTREKIINSAIEMFGEKGYEGFSINEFCRRYDFSKGILYHNFSGKDELYITGAEYCFSELICYMESFGEIKDIRTYMKLRFEFFLKNRKYEKFFFEVLLKSPMELFEKIKEIQLKLRNFNRKIFNRIISEVSLRDGITIEDASDYFDLMQEVFNRHFVLLSKDSENLDLIIENHKEKSEKLFDCILYGIIER